MDELDDPRFMRQVVIADRLLWEALSTWARVNGFRLEPLPIGDKETYRFVYT